ncbi:MAG: hypothetical protein JNL58_16040 [Planctomyces sp.]|nr:hypothetical protein [Planctomyces sp.]
MSRFSILLTGLAITGSLTGCAVMDIGRDAMTRTTSMFKPDGRDYADGTDEDGSEWNFVGDEGRADQKRERDPDPWWKSSIMSDKARNIEHNLGID